MTEFKVPTEPLPFTVVLWHWGERTVKGSFPSMEYAVQFAGVLANTEYGAGDNVEIWENGQRLPDDWQGWPATD